MREHQFLSTLICPCLYWLYKMKLNPNKLRKGRNSSVGSVGFTVLRDAAVAGLNLWASGRGHFSLGVNMGSDSIPQLFGWESKPRSSLCTHAFHHTDSKDPDIHVLDGWMQVTKNTPSMHHPQRKNVTASMAGLKTVTYAKISPKMVNPRDLPGEQRRRRNFADMCLVVSTDVSLLFSLMVTSQHVHKPITCLRQCECIQ